MSAGQHEVPFATQRIVCGALLLGMTAYLVVVGVLLQTRDGKGIAEQPIDVLATIVPVVAVGAVMGALTMRSMLLRQVDAAPAGASRSQARFRATLVPLAILEGACLFATTGWLLSGDKVPHLVASLVLLCVATVMVPFSNPDAA